MQTIKDTEYTPLLIGIFLCLFYEVAISDPNKLAEERYVDPKGYFSISQPLGWRIQQYPEDERGKVAFHSPSTQAELRILVAAVDFNTMDELISAAKSIEKEIGVPTNIEKITFLGWPAIKRAFHWNEVTIHAYDFLIGNIHHNIQYSGPVSDFYKSKSTAYNSMDTYEPLLQSDNEADATLHALAGNRRLAELSVKVGDIEQAKKHIGEGLMLDPSDASLRQLKAEVDLVENQQINISTTSIAEDGSISEEKRPAYTQEEMFIAAVVFPIFLSWLMLGAVQDIRKNESGTLTMIQLFGGLAVTVIAIGDALKMQAFLPLALGLAIFTVCGAVYWFFWVKN